ncbi:MAG: hypothetical protein ACTSX0_01385, partial [Promethearchaeota archaeon]
MADNAGFGNNNDKKEKSNLLEKKKIIDFDKFRQDFEQFVENINPLKIFETNQTNQLNKEPLTAMQTSDSKNKLDISNSSQDENFTNEWSQYTQSVQKEMENAQEQKFQRQNQQLAKKIKNKNRLKRQQTRLHNRQNRERERLKAFFIQQQ